MEFNSEFAISCMPFDIFVTNRIYLHITESRYFHTEEALLTFFDNLNVYNSITQDPDKKGTRPLSSQADQYHTVRTLKPMRPTNEGQPQALTELPGLRWKPTYVNMIIW